MIDRRKFLEHSVLGAGSMLFSSLLLGSCTKGGTTHPGGPDPGTGEPGIDWKDDARSAVIAGVGKIPEAGEVLSALMGILWPASGDSTWNQMKSNVESLMNQKLATDKYNDVTNDLGSLTPTPTGLAGNIATYTYLTKQPNPDSTLILNQWQTTYNLFINSQKHFQAEGYEVLLLPLFAQFANLFLTLLRDGALHGEKWGLNSVIPGIETLLDNEIKAYGDYVDKWIPIGHDQQLAAANKNISTGVDHEKVEPFKTVNTYNRQMTLTVLDYRNTWASFSVTKYPNGQTGADGLAIKTKDLLTREIYSDPYGCTYVDYLGRQRTTPIPLPSPLGGEPKSFPTQIAIWSGDRVDAIQVSYPQGSGPNGITQTNRMGGSGGTNGPISYDLNNPLTKFRVCTNKVTQYPTFPIIMMLWFSDSQGNSTKAYGINDPANLDDKGWINYPDEAVSSVYVNGNIVTKWPSDANCMVVGFKYWDSPAAALRAVRSYYVTSPKEKSMADLVKAFPGVTIPAGLITAELKAARLAHWAWIEAGAKK